MSLETTPLRPRAHVVGLAVCLVLAMATAASAAIPTLSVKSAGRSPIAGIQDDRIPFQADPAARVKLIAEAGGKLIRVDLRWDQVAGSRPVAPTDPADPAYNWAPYDATVTAAATYGIEVLFAVYGTPTWARDASVRSLPGYQSEFPESSIRPKDAADFGAFGEAAAKRYAPRGVKKWEAWNECNIALFLQPQYNRVGNRWAPASPAICSDLTKAFYAGVKRVDSTSVIAGGVTAPAGDRRNDSELDNPPRRVTPDDFIAALDAPELRPPMDVVSHHPYPITRPRAASSARLSYIDLYNLNLLTTAIDKTYLRGKKVWLTEYGFSTRQVPEYPRFFTPTEQAAFISDAYRRTKANPRVTMTVYYLLQDHPGWASGVLTIAGAKKPAYQAIGLPFATANGVTSVRRGSTVTLVGQSRLGQGAQVVEVQRRSGSRWVTMRRVTTSGDGSFRVSLRPTAKIALRARWAGTGATGTGATRTSPPVTLTVRR